MKSKALLFYLLCNFVFNMVSYGQITHQWSARIGKSFTNTPERVIVDNDDNIILTGTSLSTSDLFADIILAKYNSDGDSLWAYYIGKTGQSELVKGLCTDDSNNIYITGSYKGTVNFGSYNGSTHTLNSNGDYDLFVARFNPDGQIEWAASYGNVIQEYGQDVVYNSSDNLLMVVGYNNILATSETEGIAITLNPQTGTINNSATFSSTENFKFNEIECLSTDYQVAGIFSGSLGDNQSLGAYDAFIGFIDPESLQLQFYNVYGNTGENAQVWLKNVDQLHYAFGYEYHGNFSIPVDYYAGTYELNSSGITTNISEKLEAVVGDIDKESTYVAGNFTDNFYLETKSYYSEGLNIFIGKKNLNFTYLQSYKVEQGLLTDNHLLLDVNSKGNLIMAGYFSGTLKFGSSKDTVTSNSLTDIFIAQFHAQSSGAKLENIEVQNISTFTYEISGGYRYGVHVPVGTDLSGLTLHLDISENASISPDPTSVNDYRTGKTYYVTSEDKKVAMEYFIEVVADIEVPLRFKNTNSKNHFEIYPNPANQTISLKIPENVSAPVISTIRALDGRIIRSEIVADKLHPIDISDLQPGVYFITISDKSQKMDLKFIKN